VRDADPLSLLARSGAGDAFYYEVPDADFALVGLGVAESVEAEGAERFARVQGELRDRGGDALWVGGFGFADRSSDADFPAARWWRPQRLWARRGDACWGDPLPAADPAPRSPADVAPAPQELPGDDALYRERVLRALDAIGRGELEKVVVARALDLRRSEPIDPVSLLRRLRARHTACALYAVKRGDCWFVGATPERLLRREDGRFEAMALAGSARRGRSEAEDERLGRRLVESKKEQSEHAVAVRELRQALERSGATLQVPESPELLRLSGLQHLCSRIGAHWPGAAPGLLEIAGRVHPTAAVCGAPVASARDWLARHEGLERGWYAGLVGWLGRGGEGELSAALRCARLEGGRARVFAGAGIVAGSDPDAEVRETRLKWNALLPALQGP